MDEFDMLEELYNKRDIFETLMNSEEFRELEDM